jgi:hypothetical protein
MASLPNNTFASPGNPFYALVADGGGGGGSSLQSPASITPDANGAVELNMISADTTNATGSFLNIVSNAGFGGAQIQLTDTTGSNTNTAITLQYEGLGTGLVQFIGANKIIALTAPPLTGDGQLVIGQGDGGGATITKNVIIDVSNNKVTLGDPVTAVGTTPSVTVTQPLVALQQVNVQGATPGSGMFLDATGAVPSIFGSGGVSLGSVINNPILIAKDSPTLGVVVNGAIGATSNIITSAGSVQGLNVQVANGGFVSSTAAVAGGGVLNIQNAYDTATPQITMSNANTTINGLVLMPSSLSFQGSGGITAFQTFQTTGVVCGDNTTVSIPNPGGLVVGLYMILARGGSAFCSVSAISYYDGSTWKWGGGGCCPAFVSAPPSYIGIQGYGATLTLANGGGAGAVTMDFTYLKLGGSLGI